MTTYNTGNPIGSDDPRDLYDNAENLDTAMNTPAMSWTDRLGNARQSWAGATGYQQLGDYAAGIQVTTYNQVIRASGEYWRAAAGTVLPYTTTGAGMPESGKFVSVGDAVLRADLVEGDGSSIVGFQQAGTGAVVRTAQDKLREWVSVKDFGAVGDYTTDDYAAIVAADDYAASLGKPLFFPPGVYRCTNGIDKKGRWVGAGAPTMGVFPVVDDKKFLKPGSKHLIPGTSLVFSGTGTNSMTTQRSDDFASFSYCVKCDVFGSSIEGMAIVMDMDVYDAGGSLTTPATDNRADFDAGYVINDAAQNYQRDLVVFGYFSVAGTIVRSVAGQDDPDYNVFDHGSTSGVRGLALIGSQSNDGSDSGLSGSQFYGFDIFSNDHHSRASGNAAALYASAADWRCLYIDGYTDAATANINGHYFFGGCVRSYVDHTIELDHASHTNFYGTVFETSLWGVPNSSATQYLASANTTDVAMIGTRHSNEGGMANPEFGGSMTGELILVGAPGNLSGGVVVGKKNPANTDFNWVKLGGDGGSGDPNIQFGKGSFSVSTTGWSIRKDISANDLLDIRYGGAPLVQLDTSGGFLGFSYAFGGAKTIAAGAIDIGQYNFYSVATEGGAITDDLDTITGATKVGQVLILMAAISTNDVVLKDGTGNLRIAGDFTLTHAQDRITLIWDGFSWCELSRADNT